MGARFVSYLLSIVTVLCLALSSSSVLASPQAVPTGNVTAGEAALAGAIVSSSIEVSLTGPNGEALQGQVVLTLSKMGGQVVDQITAKHGSATFASVTQNEYTLSIIAPRYQSITKTVDVTSNRPVKITVALEQLSAEDAASSAGFYALPPKAQKDVGKALVALRENKPNDALHPLQAAQKSVPNSAEIEYLFGLYSSQVKNDAEARAHWMKALELNPKHLGALLSVSNDLIQQKKSAESIPYATRAVGAEPASWRAHMLLGEALLMEKRNEEAAKEAQRAIELGHERAATAQLVLAHALAQKGDRGQAMQEFEAYLKVHPADASAAKDLETLRNPSVTALSLSSDVIASDLNAAAADAAALPMASNWRPADIDDHVPAVEPKASCSVDDVVQKSGERLTDLVTDVDKFAATELLTHESINKYGLPSSPEKRKFDYVVSIQLLQGRYLDVEEYRNGAGGSSADFPGGVATNGLPSLVLIFHPSNAMNFEMSCEGLSRTGSGLAWQVHFKQRADRPNTVRRYRIGADGPPIPVALKGRAWISSDTYQILRLETDLVAPIPQIRLVADHTEIEYGPVKFQNGKVSMWLPQSADIYYDWRGQRIHRRHSFSNYLLFGVEDRQKISAPKVDESSVNTDPTVKKPEKP